MKNVKIHLLYLDLSDSDWPKLIWLVGPSKCSNYLLICGFLLFQIYVISGIIAHNNILKFVIEIQLAGMDNLLRNNVR